MTGAATKLPKTGAVLRFQPLGPITTSLLLPVAVVTGWNVFRRRGIVQHVHLPHSHLSRYLGHLWSRHWPPSVAWVAEMLVPLIITCVTRST